MKEKDIQMETLSKLSDQNEMIRMKHSDSLQKAKLGFEHFKNNRIELETREKVQNYEANMMRHRLHSLYESIGSLGDAKLVADKC